VPSAADLVREVGLGDELVGPGSGHAYLWSRGALRALPSGLVLGLPSDLGALRQSRVLSRVATTRAGLDLLVPGRPVDSDADVSVGHLVRRRMGRGVQLGLVDPLLGGINAGHTDDLSAAVAAPQILAAARRSGSLIRGLRAAGTSGTSSGAITGGGAGETGAVTARGPGAAGAAGPVFLTVRGGLGRLVDALVAGIESGGAQPGEVVTGDAAAAIDRTPGGWSVRLGSGRRVDAAAVVIACPPAASAALLQPLSPATAASLRSITTASVALTVLSYPAGALRAPVTGSGFLVPRPEGRLMTAASWVGTKWPHLARPDRFTIRASAGRVDDRRAEGLDDYELINRIHTELAEAMGLQARPLEGQVHRWPDAFPQFAPGHLDRISEAERRLAADSPGLVLAGAALRGVGIATCISGARSAAATARTIAMARTHPEQVVPGAVPAPPGRITPG
jgi:oxygen-dependent protoporphyrinogen oxidase